MATPGTSSSKYWGGMRTVVSCAEALQKSSRFCRTLASMAINAKRRHALNVERGKKGPDTVVPRPTPRLGAARSDAKRVFATHCGHAGRPHAIATCQGTAQQRIVRAHTGGSELLGGVGDFALLLKIAPGAILVR